MRGGWRWRYFSSWVIYLFLSLFLSLKCSSLYIDAPSCLILPILFPIFCFCGAVSERWQNTAQHLYILQCAGLTHFKWDFCPMVAVCLEIRIIKGSCRMTGITSHKPGYSRRSYLWKQLTLRSDVSN
jgi:hypothetical protein